MTGRGAATTRLFVAFGLLLALRPSIVRAQTAPPFPAYWSPVEASCGVGLIRNWQNHGKDIDAADTAGDNEKVISLTRENIEVETSCLTGLPSSIPSAVPVFLRDQILRNLALQINAMAHAKMLDAAEQQTSTEARIAIDQCKEPDLLMMPTSEPYSSAREMISLVLDRAQKYFPYKNTPIDGYRSELQTCALRVGRALQ